MQILGIKNIEGETTFLAREEKNSQLVFKKPTTV